MDFNELDLRLRAVEKKLKRFEVYVRSPAFRTGRRIIGGILLAAVALTLGYMGYRYLQLTRQRARRVDTALATNYPSYGSDYCRWVFGEAPGYDDCLRAEQKSFTRFEAAWHRNQPIEALREQMIGCFNASQNENGMSWKAAADCAELNNDIPGEDAALNSE